MRQLYCLVKYQDYCHRQVEGRTSFLGVAKLQREVLEISSIELLPNFLARQFFDLP